MAARCEHEGDEPHRTLDHYVLNDRGDIDGLILNNGDEVKFRPHTGAAAAMAAIQQPAATIQASGCGTANAFGTVVDAMTGSLTVGSQSIPLTGPAGPLLLPDILGSI